ncbi:MAG: 8-amino-7-oxononanoate synthase [Nitrospirales bacterium]|nr:8-amino-7-oxononanoate synthase [Nitrospira sp.]MDR4502027.1 8-amino-7-oxononanoate synthase [Nitrospirales bacterium]
MFNEQLLALENKHLRRTLKTVTSAAGPVINFEGRSVIQFGSNNYLGLANHPRVKEAAIHGIQEYGVGAGAARLLAGTQPPHQLLESDLAQFKTTESALMYGTGYSASIGTIPALAGADDLILVDRLCHASLLDGCRISRATFRIFHHNDANHLEQLLSKRTGCRKTLIVTEGVFSMDGDVAPLPDIIWLATQFGANLLIDDAHGTGVMGHTGRGTLEHFRIPSDTEALFQMGTLSKALGTVGGFVAGPRSFIEYLINTSRSFIYTTAPPASMAAAARVAIQIVQTEPGRRARLWQNRNQLHEGLKAMGFHLTNTETPILPIILRDPELATAFSANLLKRGLYAPAIRPPTVPKGTSRLRLTVTSEHSTEHINAALSAFATVKKELNVMT